MWPHFCLFCFVFCLDTASKEGGVGTSQALPRRHRGTSGQFSATHLVVLGEGQGHTQLCLEGSRALTWRCSSGDQWCLGSRLLFNPCTMLSGSCDVSCESFSLLRWNSIFESLNGHEKGFFPSLVIETFLQCGVNRSITAHYVVYCVDKCNIIHSKQM